MEHQNPFAAPTGAPSAHAPRLDVMAAWTQTIDIMRVSALPLVFGMFASLVPAGATAALTGAAFVGAIVSFEDPLFPGAAAVGGVVGALLLVATLVLILLATAADARFELGAVDRGAARLDDLWAAFADAPRLLVRMFVLTVLLVLVSIPGQSLDILARVLSAVVDDDIGPLVVLALSLAGTALNLIWSLSVTSRFIWARYYVVDQDLGPIDALTASWNASSDSKLNVVLLVIMAGMANMLGLLACCVGLLFAAPAGSLANAAVYRQFVPKQP